MLSVRTLRVQELCRHDRDTLPVNNQQRDLDTHVGSQMLHDDLIGWTMMSRIQVIPYTIPFNNRYVTCPRFDHRYPNTSFNLVTSKSLYSSHNAWSRDQTLGHLELIMMMHYRVGPEIPLRHTEWQIPVLIHVTQQTLLEMPVVYLYSHPVTLWRLAYPKHSYGIRELHDLMV